MQITSAMAEKRGTQMGKQILLVNDLPGYGKVALAAMMPVLPYHLQSADGTGIEYTGLREI